MNSPFQGKIALITGGSAGIGRAAVEAFAEAGTRVVFAARGAERGHAVAHEMNAKGHEVLFVQADVSKSEEVQRLIRQTVEGFGRIDCAFNNAAALGVVRPMAQYSEADFEAEISLNLK